MHTCMSTCTCSCLLLGMAKEAQWSMCSFRQRGREGGRQAVPSSWVIFNQQYYHASQKVLQPSHPPKRKKATHTHFAQFHPKPSVYSGNLCQIKNLTILSFVCSSSHYSPQSLLCLFISLFYPMVS